VNDNDLPGSAGKNGIIPGVTHWFAVVTVTRSGMEMDTNNGSCSHITIPT
jgi:hypothetical protein